MTTVHVPILVAPILDALLEPFRRLPPEAPTHWFVDCTLGGGGHTSGFLEALAADPILKKHHVLALDQDPGAVERGKALYGVNCTFCHGADARGDGYAGAPGRHE